ncbi:hypothetical protein [Methylophilus medardicus]|uniref:Uncharacterized protein n=1 Tax=Methylophilus medardicus TaxID=2588534 RepID=A0A5B8CU06_9PROT|nr:hypothetical protein [Methylophilus medardicus]QDC44772.1 hypothetical protein FIU01_09735 [Methylophilus medardicus]QDC49779.1 hypothetical protein FIU00_09735 [Methylophilus medardicus]QDC53484.1 hypothetical protein FIT99_09735 [Methylophilus medardicus]
MPVFDIADSLGSQSNEDIAAYLTDIGDLAAAQDFIGANVAGQGGMFPTRAWKHAGVSVGFIDPANAPANGVYTIQRASAIQADTSLIGQSLKITLDHFYVHNYPGNGIHTVLFDFLGKAQIAQTVEELHHPVKVMVADGAHAGVVSTPIFLGLNVEPNGVAFEGRTICVESSDDNFVLSAFDSPVFKAGLAIVHAAKPVLKPYTALTIAAITAIMKRKQNTQVHSFDLGLDFAQNITSNKLKLGSYLVIQSDDQIDMNNYRWNQNTSRLEHFLGPNQQIDFNYLIIGVTNYQAPALVP